MISTQLTVVGDDLKSSEGGASYHRQTRNVRRYIVHEDYDASHSNDIALIILDKPFLLTPTFSPVNVTENRTVDNEPCRTGKKKSQSYSMH